MKVTFEERKFQDDRPRIGEDVLVKHANQFLKIGHWSLIEDREDSRKKL